MNTPSLKTILDSGSDEELLNYFDSLVDRLELEEHEPSPEVKSMTRQEKTELIAMLIIELTQKARYEELRKMLRRQPVPVKDWEELVEYVHREKKRNDYNDALLAIDIFNYGYICGKRADRARRKMVSDNE